MRSKEYDGNYISTHLVGYYDNGTFYPAYCMNRELPGSDNSTSHTVNLMELLKDSSKYNKVWRVVTAGYPYHSAEELGVSDWRYAYQATKSAIYCVLGQADVDDYYGTDTEGKETANLIKKLVNTGENGTETYRTPVATVNKSGELKPDGEYYVQNYKVTGNVDIKSFNIAISGFPEDTKITDTSGKEKRTFNEGELVQIRINKNQMNKDISGKIIVEVNTKSYPVFYGKTYDEKLQNYAITFNPITLISTVEPFELKTNTAKIKVIKVDEETNEPIEGVVFNAKYEDGTEIGEFITDENGKIIIDKLRQGKIILTEIKTQEQYILDSEPIQVEVEYNESKTIEITNERIKGYVEIYKTSSDDNFINGIEKGSPLKDIPFDIYNSNKEYATTIITDENGHAITEPLDKGIYYVREKENDSWYLLDTTEYTAEIINNGDIITLNLTNEPEEPSVDIEKEGIIQTTAKQEIKYDFHIINTGNVPLDNFTWYDYLPVDYVRITKLITGTYNQDLNYSIYYKTNKNDYRLLKDNLNTQVNNYIDFSNLELETDEYVTEFKADFGTVDVGFESVIDPYIFTRVNSYVQNDDVFTNKTRIEGYNKTYMVWDEDEHTTKVYEKEINVKKLPRTGM